MKIKFYGVRGSVPTPSNLWRKFRTQDYGGETTCFLIQPNSVDYDIVVDGGSGLRNLGYDYLQQKNFNVNIKFFLTHYHHDHIQGIPFMPQMHMASSKFHFYGLSSDGVENTLYTQTQEYLRHEQLPPFFPVFHDRMLSKKDYTDLVPGASFDLCDSVSVDTFPLNHPNGGIGYKFEQDGKSICVASDSEHYDTPNAIFKSYCNNTDLLICDGQYTDEEYNGNPVSKQGWGHGTTKACVREAIACNAKRLAIVHHDPSHDDDKLYEMRNEVCQYAKEKNYKGQVDLILEGTEIEV